MRLDQILLSRGLVTESAIREALESQSVLGGRLGEHLVEKGHISHRDLADALSEQFGVPGVELSEDIIDPNAFPELPLTVAEEFHCLVVAHNSAANALSVAFADPNDQEGIEAVRRAIFPAALIPNVASESQIRQALQRWRAACSPIARPDQVHADSTEFSSQSVDQLIDLLELAVTGHHQQSRSNAPQSVWAARLACEVAGRVGQSAEIRQSLRLAALFTDIAGWQHPRNQPRSSTSLMKAARLAHRMKLPGGIETTLEECAAGMVTDGPTHLQADILLTAWRLAVSRKTDGENEESVDQWERRFRKENRDHRRGATVETAFSVLRARALRERLSGPPREIIVAGLDPFVGDLIGLMQNVRWRTIVTGTWEDAIQLVRRRCPDFLCVHVPSAMGSGHELTGNLLGGVLDLRRVLFVIGPDVPMAVSSLIRLGARAFSSESTDLPGIIAQIRKTMDLHDTDGNQNAAVHGDQGRSEREPSVSGRLADLGLADLVQVLSSAGKTVQLLLSRDGDEASLWFERGEIVHAQSDTRKGEDVFFHLLEWSDGRFEVHPAVDLPPRSISARTTALLLDGLRRLDESRRTLAEMERSQIALPE